VVNAPSDIAIEPALAHAISRQESEFNPKAKSSADARGLMQLLPGTAKMTAKKIGVPYGLSELNNPAYNMQLGSAFLGEMIDKFGGSYVLAIAAYNAGPGRSVDWMDRFGVPGASAEDSINWIESIPFGETRNYVQRVLENLQVYRYRLSGGKDARIRLTEDLQR